MSLTQAREQFNLETSDSDLIPELRWVAELECEYNTPFQHHLTIFERDRPDLKISSSFIRLQKFLYFCDGRLINFAITFRSHTEYIPVGNRGLYFSRGIGMTWGDEGSGHNKYICGPIDDFSVRAIHWEVPSIMPLYDETFNLDTCDIRKVILNDKKAYDLLQV